MVDPLEILLAAGVELGPYFAVAGVENRQCPLDLLLVELRGVGDDHELDLRQDHLSQHVGTEGDNLVELRHDGGLAVAAEGHVVDPPHGRRRGGESLVGPDSPAGGFFQHLQQFASQHVQVKAVQLATSAPVDLAIGAGEGAPLVGIEVHPDAEALAPPRDHGVHVAAVAPLATVVANDRKVGRWGRFAHDFTLAGRTGKEKGARVS